MVFIGIILQRYIEDSESGLILIIDALYQKNGGSREISFLNVLYADRFCDFNSSFIDTIHFSVALI